MLLHKAGGGGVGCVGGSLPGTLLATWWVMARPSFSLLFSPVIHSACDVLNISYASLFAALVVFKHFVCHRHCSLNTK